MNTQITLLLDELLSKSTEHEWLEFKLNFHNAQELGEQISALSNGACIAKQSFGYLIFGIEDATTAVVGTNFRPKSEKYKGQDLMHWVLQRLSPRIEFKIYELEYQGKDVVVFKIPAAWDRPTSFFHKDYIRIGSITRELKDFPEKERIIWKNAEKVPIFEKELAVSDVPPGKVLEMLDVGSFFELLKIPHPQTEQAVFDRLLSAEFVAKCEGPNYAITNLGAILFANDLTQFPELKYKQFRVVTYKGKNKLETIRDYFEPRGYAAGFKSLINYIDIQLPQKEEIGAAFREIKKAYPERALRELIVNAIVHQDFSQNGSPLLEIFSNKIEITNPGVPLIEPLRFIDEYYSRNETLSDFMHRLGICEKKGSGIDAVLIECEINQLPPPDFQVQQRHTKAILFSKYSFNEMDKNDRLRACYQHCCLKYMMGEKMTNQSLRERLQIKKGNSAVISRLIKDAKKLELIKDDDPSSTSLKYARYLPIWA